MYREFKVLFVPDFSDDVFVLDSTWGQQVMFQVTPEEWDAWHDRSYPIEPQNFDWTALDVGY